MYIEKIEWLDEEEREAILEIVNDTNSLICFSCPCAYNLGMVLTEPLECLDISDVVLSATEESSIESMDEIFKYKLRGQLKDIKTGILEVYGFLLHIDEKKIPGDIINGQFIQLVVSRIDVW